MNPVIPPRPDVSYVGATKGPPTPPERQHSSASSSSGKTPSRREPPPLPPHPGAGGVEGDWEAREELRMRELEEARARAAQMEKTMRWWSDCTSNWREKWGKVRNERNKARDECRHLRNKLESNIKETATLKREKQELVMQLDAVRKQLDSYQNLEKERNSVCSSGSHKSGHGSDHEQSSQVESVKEQEKEDFVSKLLSKKDRDLDSTSSRDSDKSEKKRVKKSGENSPASGVEESAVKQKLNVLQVKLEETQKTVQQERDEKSRLASSVEDQRTELVSLQAKYDSLLQQNHLITSQLHQSERRSEVMTSELEEEEDVMSDKDKRLAHLRKELERLQCENAVEWDKREQLETEKLALERENKQLKAEIKHLQEDVERKSRQAASVLDSDIKTLTFDLTEKNKELMELKHVHNKVKKQLADKTAELDHAKSRSEQYEVEVRKLRGRIEELKRELATAEDEVDQQSNQIRRLQRTNDELQEQAENLQVTVEHLQTRLRRSSSQPMLSTRASSLKSFDMNLDTNDLSTDANTDDDEEEEVEVPGDGGGQE